MALLTVGDILSAGASAKPPLGGQESLSHVKCSEVQEARWGSITKIRGNISCRSAGEIREVKSWTAIVRVGFYSA
jgi:hypothetical protein